jgi:hypothetical protein
MFTTGTMCWFDAEPIGSNESRYSTKTVAARRAKSIAGCIADMKIFTGAHEARALPMKVFDP